MSSQARTRSFPMQVQADLHPTPETLSAYGLGKLDEAALQAVAVHLDNCSTCRGRVEAAPADSFIGRVRQARPVINAARSIFETPEDMDTTAAQGPDPVSVSPSSLP